MHKRIFVKDLIIIHHAMLHFNEIANERTDALLIVNEDKENIKNYIGPNSFAEVAMGFYFGKKYF